MEYLHPVRIRAANGALSVHAIVGTHVALFGMDLPKEATDGLLGFAIRRTNHDDGKRFYLRNFLLFKTNDKGKASNHSSLHNPFQEFLWGDYTLRPEQTYTYRIVARYGEPGKLTSRHTVELEVTTESEDDERHGVFFNRGVAGSQRYAEKFHNRRPKDVGPEAYEWLSRGLAESMTAFIRQADGPGKGLRAAVYELTHEPVVHEFAEALQRGADVRIVYDAVDNAEDYPAAKNTALIADEGLAAIAKKRTRTAIAHNKFVVLLEKGKPTQVWTGSTNITEGALYGQLNVGHVIRDRRVAKAFLEYWTTLLDDPARKDMRLSNDERTPTPAGPPPQHRTIPLFSPRKGLSALEWYAGRMDAATQSVFLTAAFGVSAPLQAIFEKPKPYLRYLLLDKPGKVTTINRNPANRVAAGGYLGKGGWRQWLEEALTDLNKHVRYVHTKVMLIDPLGDDPIVITGSANFSKASTTDNDENMLVIRGDTRVADIYLGEFMRVFTHFRFRGKTKTDERRTIPSADVPGAPRGKAKLYLRETDAWARRFYVAGSTRERERLLFR